MTFKSTLLFAALISLSAASCKQNDSPAAGDHGGIPDSVTVDLATAKKYVQNYESHAGHPDMTPEDIKERKPRKPDTRAIWFSKERLQQMITQLDKEGGDGVRFYLITYDNKYDTTATLKPKKPIPPSKYWGYNTLLMVSTKDSTVNNKKLHFDYYNYATVGSETKVKDKKKGFIVTYTPENRGEICPPPANCNEEGATLIQQ